MGSCFECYAPTCPTGHYCDLVNQAVLSLAQGQQAKAGMPCVSTARAHCGGYGLQKGTIFQSILNLLNDLKQRLGSFVLGR